jgi:hypothetical protein
VEERRTITTFFLPCLIFQAGISQLIFYWPLTGISTISFLGFFPGFFTAGIPESPACRWQLMGLPQLFEPIPHNK